MGYQYSSFNPHGNTGVCNAGTHWFPTWTNTWEHQVKDTLTNAYMAHLGRYAEPGGLEGYYNSIVAAVGYGGAFTTTWLYDMVYYGGLASGELYNVWNYGRHTNMRLGYCIIYGCTNPSASNYNSSANVDDGSCIIPGCTDPAANNYNSSANQDNGSCTYDTVWVSISASPNPLCSPNSVTISWATQYAVSASISGYGGVSTNQNGYTSGSFNTTPYSNQTYTISATGKGPSNTTSSGTTVTVYQQPSVQINSSNSTIIIGESTTLSWSTTGTVSSSSINQGIGGVPNSSNTSVSPTTTTTYTITSNGYCGTASDSTTITVLTPPTATITGPSSINYGDTLTFNYSTTYSTSRVLTITYNYYDQVLTDTVNVSESGSYSPTITWTDHGPHLIYAQLAVSGAGGNNQATESVPVNIDTTPDLFTIPASEDKMPDEENIISPDVSITSSEVQVEDIDIPVEIKSSNPILIDIDDQDNWQEIRQI